MKMNIKNVLKILVMNIIIFFGIFVVLEITCRAIFPEFKDDIHSPSLTYGKHLLLTDNLERFEGISIRVPYPDYKLNQNDDIILILGDSISNGYGHSYEDIYWNKFQRLVNMLNSDPIQVVALSGYGNNLADSKAKLEEYLDNKKLPEIKIIMYQFNLNDITPYGRRELKKREGYQGIRRTEVFRRFAKFRYEYLNKSVFLRVVQHYSGVFSWNRDGSCEERKIDALGNYTWTFGSKPFKSQSETLWEEFENDLRSMKELSDSIGAKFIIFISPILYDIDQSGYHPYYNCYKLDFTCATIDPRKRLRSITKQLDIDIIDPAVYIRKHFEKRIQEHNFTPFFFTADNNHFTPITSGYIAEYLFSYYANSFPYLGKNRSTPVEVD